MLSQRPCPTPSALTAPFWEAARRRVLVRPVCDECGRSFFTPQIACPACLSENWTYRPSSGRGVIYSATLVHRAPLPGLETPYRIAIVDLDEGWSMLTNVLDVAVPAPIGATVEVAWLELNEEIVLPAFRLSEPGSAP
jgi:uncharacterized OB-fold protein